MKKYLFLLLFLIFDIAAAEIYYSRAMPFEIFKIKSSTTGEVVTANYDLEGRLLDSIESIVEIDKESLLIDLKYSKNKLDIVNKILSIEKDIYNSIKRVKTKPKIEKDNQLIKILNIESTISDLNSKIDTLEDSILQKSYQSKGYISKIYVREGDYVSFGTSLYDIYDISKSKMSIFIPIKDIDTIKDKKIYIDDKISEATISKIYRVANDEFISSYQVDIILESIKNFSKLHKIEFRD